MRIPALDLALTVSLCLALFGSPAGAAQSNAPPGAAAAPVQQFEGVVLRCSRAPGGSTLLFSTCAVTGPRRGTQHLTPPGLDTVLIPPGILLDSADGQSAPSILRAGQSLVVEGEMTGGVVTAHRVRLRDQGETPASLEQKSYQVFQLVQEMRLRDGIDRPGHALRWNPILTAIALRRAQRSLNLMLKGQPFDRGLHLSDNDPESASRLMTRLGYVHTRYMENMDWCDVDDPVGIYQDWEASPAHAMGYRQPGLTDAGVVIIPCPRPDSGPEYLAVLIAGSHRG